MFLMIPRQRAETIPGILGCCDAAFVAFMDNPLFENTAVYTVLPSSVQVGSKVSAVVFTVSVSINLLSHLLTRVAVHEL